MNKKLLIIFNIANILSSIIGIWLSGAFGFIFYLGYIFTDGIPEPSYGIMVGVYLLSIIIYLVGLFGGIKSKSMRCCCNLLCCLLWFSFLGINWVSIIQLFVALVGLLVFLNKLTFANIIFATNIMVVLDSLIEMILKWLDIGIFDNHYYDLTYFSPWWLLIFVVGLVLIFLTKKRFIVYCMVSVNALLCIVTHILKYTCVTPVFIVVMLLFLLLSLGGYLLDIKRIRRSNYEKVKFS